MIFYFKYLPKKLRILNFNYFYILIILIISTIIIGCSSSKSSSQNSDAIEESEYYLNTSELDNTYAKDYVIRGSIFEQQRSYANAILDYFEALKFDSSASIMWAIAKCYKYLNRLETALDWAWKSYETDSNFAPAIELLADLYFIRYDISNAINFYEKLVKIKPNLHNKMKLAVMYELNEPQKAIEIYESLIENGDDINVLKQLSDLYLRVENKEKYLNMIEKIYNYTPYDYETAFILFNALIKYQDYEKAYNILDKLELSLSSTDFNLLLRYFANALLVDSTNTNEQFIRRFLEKIDNKRRFEWRLQLFSAYLAHRIGDTTKVESLISQTLKIADTIKDVPIEVYFFYTFANKHRKAIEILSYYEKDFPDDYRYPFFIAISYSNLNQYDSSLHNLYKCLKLNDTSLSVWSQIGIVYDQLGMIDSSDYAYQKALEINPYDALVNNNYAYSLSVRGIELEKALSMIKISLNAEPNNPSYLDTYGWIMFKLNNLEEALKYIDKAISLKNTNAEVWEHRGDILKSMGKIEEAIKSWEKVLELEPNRFSAEERLNKYKK